ncbi:MAG: hypothetical protein ACRDZ9_09670 [Acidimicrobiales bacterium]
MAPHQARNESRLSPASDWAAETADTVERTMSSIRARTVDPLERIARALVFGLLAGMVGTAAAVLAAIAAVRALDILIPGPVWSAHLVVGGIFVLTGLFVWRKSHATT